MADLGDDEIVLCARVDGHVVGYYTHVVSSAVHQKPESLKDSSLCPIEIKPFFHVDVRESAWGLAVHKEARLIAVSANSHKIHVYAFALTMKTWDSNDGLDDRDFLESSEPSEYDLCPSPSLIPEGTEKKEKRAKCLNRVKKEWNKYKPERFPQHIDDFRMRTQNWLITLTAHRENVPCVTFCNTGEDPHGRLLISSDISGNVILWDLDRAQWSRASHPTNDQLNMNQRVHDWAVWNMQWIDKRAFRKTRHPSVALQYCTLWNERYRSLADITVNRDRVKESGPWKILRWRQQGNQEALNLSSRQGMTASNNSTSDDGEEEIAMNTSEESGDDISEDSEGHHHTELTTAVPGGGLDVRLNPSNWCVDMTSRLQWPSHAYQPANTSFNPKYRGGYAVDPLGWIHQDGNRSKELQPPYQPDDPFLILNPRNISLFQSSLSMSSGASGPRYPTIWMEDPLKQEISEGWRNQFRGMDLVKLLVQVPDLGILLVGNLAGRVAVFSLHQLHPNPFHENPHRPVYTMRLDHILPRESQEHRGERPRSVLIGLAASPIQGHADTRSPEGERGACGGGVNASRRWRVLMLYNDQTMLSYELTRMTRNDEARKAQTEELLIV